MGGSPVRAIARIVKPTPPPAPPTPAPTTAEVSQSSATDATTVDTDDPTYIKRKNKRKGRSLTILTSSKGTSEGLTLGKRSLLGQA